MLQEMEETFIRGIQQEVSSFMVVRPLGILIHSFIHVFPPQFHLERHAGHEMRPLHVGAIFSQ